MLKDIETDKLVPKVRRHRRGVRSDEKISISKTILDYVVERNEGVMTSDARDDKRWDPGGSIVKLGVREAICVPMQGRYNVVGVIYIDTSITPQRMMMNEGKPDQFTEEHLRLMIAIAHQAALAVEDTSYYKGDGPRPNAWRPSARRSRPFRITSRTSCKACEAAAISSNWAWATTTKPTKMVKSTNRKPTSRST